MFLGMNEDGSFIGQYGARRQRELAAQAAQQAQQQQQSTAHQPGYATFV